MSLATLLVAAATLVAAMVGTAVAWWVPKQIRVRDVVRSGAPDLDVSLSRRSGPGGTGFLVRVKNVGAGRAYGVTLAAPALGMVGSLIADVLAASGDAATEIPIDERSSLLTTAQAIEPAVLTYRDRFEFLYRRKIHIEQRPDGQRFVLAADARRYKTETPILNAKDTWRLRHE